MYNFRRFSRITFIFFLSFFLFRHAECQNPYAWITPNTDYLKMSVISDGIFRINKSDFIQAGINVNFDPRSVKVYFKGQQIPIDFEGEQDGVFDDNDYFDFYGVRDYGGLTNTYREQGGQLVTAYVTDEYYNIYSDTSAYWVGWGGTFGSRMPRSATIPQTPYPRNYFYDKIHFEKDIIYSLGETINANTDFRYFNTEKVQGEGWYWKELPNGGTLLDSFRVPDLYPGSQTCSLRVFAYPNSMNSSGTNEHQLTFFVNGTQVNQSFRTHYNRFDTTITFSGSLLSATSNNTFLVHYAGVNPANWVPRLYFDLVEIQYPRRFSFRSNEIKFNLTEPDSSSRILTLTGFIPSNQINIYDVTYGIKIVNFSSNSDTLSFSGKGNASFCVVNKYITNKPFRIARRRVSDLVSFSNTAQHLIIYNNIFSNQAEQLRSHRQTHDTLNSFKADVQDVIDVFNFGMEDPIAVRRFTDYVYRNWQAPQLRYICLFGRGSLDPKNHYRYQDVYRNLVPIYGNPQSDGYFANFNWGTFTYFNQAAVGRLPAYTVNEAQTMVDKIIAYDNVHPDVWWKRFIMITGGADTNSQRQFQSQSNYLVNTFIRPPPVSGDVHKIYRTDSAGYITYNYRDSIKNEINRGGLVVNFIGHAAFQDWEVGLEDPNTLSNGDRLPLVLSMTCFTGINARDSVRGFGEKFMYLPFKGSIGFIGTTGWSFISQGNSYNNYLFEGISQQQLRRIGDLTKYATVRMSPDSFSFAVKNTINSYGLLGDPAQKLLLPTHPEFDIQLTDYKISDPYPRVHENVNLTIFPKNLGTFADSCKIRFQILRNSQNYLTRDTIVRNFGFIDTLYYLFRLDTLGNYAVRISLDADNWYTQEFEGNNLIAFGLPLRNISYIPFKPINNSVIREDSVEFTGLNPLVDPRSKSIRIILQADTSKTFNSTLASTFTNSNISGVITKFNYHLPRLDSNVVYYWRTNSIINNDSVGWSEINKFVYNTGVTLVRSENIKGAKNQDSNIIVYRKLPGQFEPYELVNTFYGNNGIELRNFPGLIDVRSWGIRDQGPLTSYLTINNRTIYGDSAHRGLNLAKVSKHTGRLIDYRNFRMNSPQSSDSVLNYLNTCDTSQYLISQIVFWVENSDSLHQTAKNKFKEFGSHLADSVSRFVFDTWSFIGYLGADTGSVSEQFHKWPSPNQGCPNDWCASNSTLSPTFISTSGSIISPLGPAHRWKNFSWGQILSLNSLISFDIIGIRQSDDSTLLYSNVVQNAFVNLDTVSSFVYPKLLLQAKLSIDTVSGYSSPVFQFLNFKYTPPAELIPDNFSFTRSDTSVQEGADVTITVRNYNVGFVPANIFLNKWTAVSPAGIRLLKADTVYVPLRPDSVRICSVTFSTAGLRERTHPKDTVRIYFETSILGNENDYYTFNNFAFTSITVAGDSLPPLLDVLYDGVKIINGDYIQANPEIIYKFHDNSKVPFTLADTANIFIIQDDSIRVPYYFNGKPNALINFNPVNQQDVKVIVTYKPVLSEGEHIFKYAGGDNNGNSDTLTNIVNVSYTLKVRNLYNYPNPMRNDTYFTFELLGQKNPGSYCRIRIYTVAGRLIKELPAPSRIGFNTIYWDGRDNDGETIANGIYLYKLIVEDQSKTETSIQKLAVLK